VTGVSDNAASASHWTSGAAGNSPQLHR